MAYIDGLAIDQRRLDGERGDRAGLLQEFWEISVVQVAATNLRQ